MTPTALKICCYPSAIRFRWSRDSLVGIGTTQRSILGRGHFSLRHKAHTGSATHPAYYCNVHRGLSPKVKRLVNAVTLHPPSADVKMGWATPFPSTCVSSLDKAFIFEHFLVQTATSRWECHTAQSTTPIHQFWFYQTVSTPWRWE